MRKFRAVLILLVAFTLVAGACTDSDDEEGSDGNGGGGNGGGAGATFEFRPLDAGGPTTKAALEDGTIDIALLFSSDGYIVANDLVALEDDMDLQPVDNFIPAIRADANNEEVAAVINAVSEALSVEAMQEMSAAVGIDGEDPRAVAEGFLDENDLPGDLTATGELTVGSANFAESTIAAQLYAVALERAGATVATQLDIGAREAYLPALERGDIDLIPEFVGTLLTVLGGEPTSDLEQTTTDARAAAEEQGYTLLAPSEADSVNTFVVTQETADEYSLMAVSDLADVEESLTLGGPPECRERQPCIPGLEEVYGLQFAS